MGASEGRQRRWQRAVPAHAVRVAAESERLAATSGEAVNFSDGGACLALQTPDLAVGDELILWLTFAGLERTVPATGRIVWAASGRGRPRYGVQWTHQGPQRSWISWLVGN